MQTPPDPNNQSRVTQATEKITPASAFTARIATDAVISPDGKQVAFVLAQWLPEQAKIQPRIWITETSGHAEPQPLNSGLAEEFMPRWSPDGAFLAFVGRNRHEQALSKSMLYLSKSGTTGKATLIYDPPTGLSDIQWAPDSGCIAFLSREEIPAVDPHVATPRGQMRLWTVLPSSEASPEPITGSDLSVWSYSWSPDQKQFATFFTNGSEETDWYRGQIGVVSATGGQMRQISNLTRPACEVRWTPDGSHITYISGQWSDPDRGGGDIYSLSLDGGEAKNLKPNIQISPTWYRWLPDGRRLLFTAFDSTSSQVGILEAETGKIITLSRNFTLGERYYPHLSITPDFRRLVATHSENHAPDVWLGTLTQLECENAALNWQQCTHFNSSAEKTLKIYPTEKISYTGADGWHIEALLTLPEAQSDTPLPLVVNVHGGPSAAWINDWDNYRTQALVAEGYAVLKPNIRGSLGRGTTFADAVVGDMGGKDFQDVLLGVDYLIERGLVDSERVGLMGWSYGGFMVAWAVSQTDRFKAAVMGAGICDFHSYHAESNIPDWDMRFLSKEIVNPYDHPNIYRNHSAITYANRITTPTLIIHGEADECVPVNQAHAFYRALHEQHIPVELVTYPREGHGFTEQAHIQDHLERVANWFNKHLGSSQANAD